MARSNRDVYLLPESAGTRWRPRLGVPSLTLLVAVFIVAADNRAFWHQLAAVSHVGTAGHYGFAIAVAVFMVGALSLMMSVFAFRFIYKPICKSNRPQECSTAELTNSYDDTVRYVDHILASLIGVLKKQDGHTDTALMYLSDHGESLGEDGIYLHGFPYLFAPSEQTHIPMIAWLSPGFMQHAGITRACAKKQTTRAVGQDNVFDTLMGLMGVRASLYRPSQDIFAPCRQRS